MRLVQVIFGLLLMGCSSSLVPNDDDVTVVPELYFPPITGDEWATILPDSLGWNTSILPNLYTLLENNGTRAFIVLKDGKIVIEQYFGKDLLNRQAFDKNKNWYWASAGKTLTAFMVGLAQQDGYLNITDKTSNYLGKGWTSLSPDKEDKITIWHQLTMTSGLDDGVANSFDTSKVNLIYKADAGNRWAYHNAPYTLLDRVVESAVQKSFEEYFNLKLADKIGMKGFWLWNDQNHILYSNARSMARFGLLILNKGMWDNAVIMSDSVFFNAMVNTSQNLNKSYGYLWWLNGKDSYMVPQSQLVLKGSVTPFAPNDMVSALGKNGQFLSVIPSKGIVMVRMGENPDNSLVPFMFQNDIWEILSKVIK